MLLFLLTAGWQTGCRENNKNFVYVYVQYMRQLDWIERENDVPLILKRNASSDISCQEIVPFTIENLGLLF